MIPDWMKKNERYVPPKGGGAFAVKTMRSLGKAVGKLIFQQGHEKKHALPALVKFFLLVVSILLLAVCLYAPIYGWKEEDAETPAA